MRTSNAIATALAIVLSLAPAAADESMDQQCVSLGQSLHSEVRSCGGPSGYGPIWISRNCLLRYDSELHQAAAQCINGAQDHFDAAHDMGGYDADHQYILAVAELGVAAFANYYLAHRDLAVSQIQYIIKIATQVRDDPDAGNLRDYAVQAISHARDALAEIARS